jgi:hypothetical protein
LWSAESRGYPVTFNQPTTFTIYFYALAQISVWSSGSSATADFSHTAILDQIVVLDSQNQVVPDFTIASASGTSYGPQGVVPEPASVVLLASSILVLWFIRIGKFLLVS